MQSYQLDYIKNCSNFRSLTTLPRFNQGSFDAEFGNTMKNMLEATDLSRRNTILLNEHLMPVLNDLYGQPLEIIKELEDFADELSKPPAPLDIALADQVFSALLTVARYNKRIPRLVRLLYKSGMVKYRILNLFTAVNYPEIISMSNRMRQLFTEGASYVTPFEYFDSLDSETKSYALRSLANIYLGQFDNWQDKAACVRHTMSVFNDPRYRKSAPDVPWDRFIDAIHRQMCSVIPHPYPIGTVPPEAIADIMDSAYIVYQSQNGKAVNGNTEYDARRRIPYFNVQFCCGIITRRELLSEFEKNLNVTNLESYDDETMYRVISLPAFYIQELIKDDKMLEKRTNYVFSLYERALDYIERMPDSYVTEHTRFYARQFMMGFVELDGGITYSQFVLAIMKRFTPELYAHGYSVGCETAEIADALFLKQNNAFDDIPFIADISDIFRKRDAIRELAMDAGLLHDTGKIGLATLYNHAGRHLLRSEETMMRVHSLIGRKQLDERKSTKKFASVALGHHKWYCGNGGYPDEYNRENDNYRVLVDIVALTDYLDAEKCDNAMLPIRTVPFEQKVYLAKKLSGTRFSSQILNLLDDTELYEKLRKIYDSGRREGYYKCAMSKNNAIDKDRDQH